MMSRSPRQLDRCNAINRVAVAHTHTHTDYVDSTSSLLIIPATALVLTKPKIQHVAMNVITLNAKQ